MLQKAVVHRGSDLGHADALAEIADGCGGIAAAAQTAQGRHTRIVPAGDDLLFDEPAQLALGHDGIVDAETRKFDLARLTRDGDIVHDPVVQRAVVLILQRAETVRDALQRVLNRVGEVIHREDAPVRALTVMLNVADAVEHRVAHVEVAGGEVDLCAQRVFALRELSRAHAAEQVETFRNRPVAPRADGGGVHVPAVFAELLRRELAHVGQPLFDQLHGVLIVLLKIVGAEEKPVAPVKAQPVNILLNGFDELVVLLGGVRVVHAQVADTAKFFGHAEINAQRLAVPNVQVAVRLRRKTGVDLLPGETAALGEILLDECFNKIFRKFFHVFNSTQNCRNIIHDSISVYNIK